jgi:hypothetical protein
MKRSTKILLSTSVLAFVATVAFIFHWRAHDSKLANFESIAIGMTSDDVVRMIGTPDSVHPCNGWEFLNYDDPSCSQAYVYASTLAPLVPYYPVVWFNKDRKVIKVYAYSSP